MRIIPFIYDDIDDLFANTYVVVDSFSNCVVIDPSKDNDNLLNYLIKNNFVLKGVLLTHAHFDHIRGASRLLKHFSCPLYCGFEEKDALKDPKLNCSRYMSKLYIVEEEPALLADKEVLTLLEEPIKVIATPFHTKGSLCFYLEKTKALFSGDFLFEYSIGRSDLPGGSPKDFHTSINKIMCLEDSVKVYPGHGNFTSIGKERTSNPFLK